MSQWIVTPDKFLTDEESKKLRRMCEEAAIIAKSKGNQMAVRNRLIIEMALGTGLRVSELANLKVDDIHIRKGQYSLTVNNGKGGKDRIVGFNNRVKLLIQEYLDYRNSHSSYLFPSERGDKMTWFGIGRVFKTMAAKASLGSKHSIHTLRHTYATNLYKASGYNVRMVQKQLGHSSITTTTVYCDVLNQDLTDALENLE
ncbi:MAG: tyrosine-type recombinase/integrase [Candidatus Marinimicrobia bacterium]|nr:tyrosine-type recombinase/integrase [Candidatus Neomarinimicrobiota bacterium]